MRKHMRIVPSIIVWTILSVLTFAGTPETLRKDVAALASSPRVTGSVDCVRASNYIKAELTKIGLVAETRAFGRSNNVLSAVGDSKTVVIVVGAHYDSVGTTPGADDNASGTAVVLELARRFKARPTFGTVVFLFFSGEEQGMVGSAAYVRAPKYTLSAHKAMINIDMVGHLKRVSYDGAVLDLPKIVAGLYLRFPFAHDITLRGNDALSDNSSFAERGIPSLFLHTGLHNAYHRQTDTTESLNYTGMAQVTDYAEGLVRACADSLIPDYNFFKQLRMR
jgi:Zn-dependent M28 family amino/carboxypeptidase